MSLWRKDSPRPLAVALLVLFLVACGPTVRPTGPGNAPTDTGMVHSPVPLSRPSRQLVIGEMCPTRANGRPAVTILAVRETLTWSAEPESIAAIMARGTVQLFRVLDYKGNYAGTFTVAGTVDMGMTTPVALGGYAGSSPCKPDDTEDECRRVLRGCGIAIAPISRYGSDETISVNTGGACMSRGQLAFDSDGDGTRELFPVRAFLDAMRAPPEEVTGITDSQADCKPRFAVPNIVRGTNPKIWRGLDVLGVADLDDDGRHELILRYRYGHKSTWAVYSPSQVSTRLVLVAEGVPWR